MKKTLLFFSAIFILAGCESPSPVMTPEVETNIETTGAYEYFVGEAPTGIALSALGELCFTPAQLDTTNGGELFCFSNKTEALTALNLEDLGECETYWYGTASVEIKNLSTSAEDHLKSDACFEEGNCDFNTAELVNVVEMISAPRCEGQRAEDIHQDPLGFSFSVPDGWTLGGTNGNEILINEAGDTLNVTYYSGKEVKDVDSKFGDVTYFFDEALNEWQVVWNTDEPDMDKGPKTAVPSFYTDSGLPVFAGIGRWKTDILVLSPTEFLIVNITGSGDTADLDPFVKTITLD